MKTIKLKLLSLVLAVILFSFGTEVNAQRNQGNQGRNFQNNQTRECNIPDLTDAQKSKIEVLRTSQLKEATAHRSLMDEKRAHLNTLRIADKPDMKAINSTIDEMGALRTKHIKNSEAHRQSVRALLTDSQKVYFDSRRGNRGNRGMGQGRGQYGGKGMRGGRGMGNGRGGAGYGRGMNY